MLWLNAKSSEALGATIAIVKAPPPPLLLESSDPHAVAPRARTPSTAMRLEISLSFFLILFSFPGFPR